MKLWIVKTLQVWRHMIFTPLPLSQTVTLSDPLPLGAWHTLWTAPKGQTLKYSQGLRFSFVVPYLCWGQKTQKYLIVG